MNSIKMHFVLNVFLGFLGWLGSSMRCIIKPRTFNPTRYIRRVVLGAGVRIRNANADPDPGDPNRCGSLQIQIRKLLMPWLTILPYTTPRPILSPVLRYKPRQSMFVQRKEKNNYWKLTILFQYSGSTTNLYNIRFIWVNDLLLPQKRPNWSVLYF